MVAEGIRILHFGRPNGTGQPNRDSREADSCSLWGLSSIMKRVVCWYDGELHRWYSAGRGLYTDVPEDVTAGAFSAPRPDHHPPRLSPSHPLHGSRIILPKAHRTAQTISMRHTQRRNRLWIDFEKPRELRLGLQGNGESLMLRKPWAWIERTANGCHTGDREDS